MEGLATSHQTAKLGRLPVWAVALSHHITHPIQNRYKIDTQKSTAGARVRHKRTWDVVLLVVRDVVWLEVLDVVRLLDADVVALDVRVVVKLVVGEVERVVV